MIDRATGEQLYPCADCGVLRTKAEGGTVFTVCDGCWDKHHPPASIGAKLLSATREQLIEEILRLRGELSAQQRTSSALLSAAERVAYSKLQLGAALLDEDRESLRALIAAVVAARKEKDPLRGSGGGPS